MTLKAWTKWKLWPFWPIHRERHYKSKPTSSYSPISASNGWFFSSFCCCWGFFYSSPAAHAEEPKQLGRANLKSDELIIFVYIVVSQGILSPPACCIQISKDGETGRQGQNFPTCNVLSQFALGTIIWGLNKIVLTNNLFTCLEFPSNLWFYPWLAQHIMSIIYHQNSPDSASSAHSVT